MTRKLIKGFKDLVYSLVSTKAGSHGQKLVLTVGAQGLITLPNNTYPTYEVTLKKTGCYG